ncbi:MAG: HEAT repeat domain-containing protein [Alphaproteobacteria bacterium]|nr:HEAT repeat domain-containing protein [Alphaproteobacteria bacterium]MCB9695282.1 HEAT repeat domain-containing protein [Alphaproteobacteria bacterium]
MSTETEVTVLVLLTLGCHKVAPAQLDAIALEDADAASARVRDPGTVLEELSTGGTPTVRARAFALLIGHTEVDRWAAAGLQDESSWVQRATIEALVPPIGPETRERLLAVAQDGDADPWVRGAAATRAEGPEARVAMSAAWTSPTDPLTRLPSALAALELGDDQAHPFLVASLETGELPLDLQFLRELSARPDPAFAHALATAQPVVEWELQLQVAGARVRLGDPSAEQVLRRALADDDEERRAEAVDVLADLDDPVAVTLLRRAVSQGPDFVAAYAEVALAGRGVLDASTFTEVSELDDFELRQLAVRHAGRAARLEDAKSARKAVDVVLAGLEDRDGSVRAEAARASGELRLQDAAPRLRQLLDDDRDAVRVEAAGALLAL